MKAGGEAGNSQASDPAASDAAPDTAPQAAPGIVLGPAPDAAPSTAPGDIIKDSSTENFMADVIEASNQVPVIVDFWAPWCEPCKQLTPALEKLVKEAAGMVRLVKINVDENQDLAGQMKIKSIPAVYAFDKGQPVDGFSGALPESQLKAFIGKLTGDAKSPVEESLEQAQTALAAGDTVTAGGIFAQVQAQNPGNETALAGMIRVALAADKSDEAEQMIDSLPDDLKAKPEIAAAITAFELSQASQNTGEADELLAALEKDENNHQARFDLAMALYGQGQNEAAIDALLELFKRNRKWNDEAARNQLLKIFEALGPTDPLTMDGRKRLSTMLFS